MTAGYQDRAYYSQYAIAPIGLQIHKAGALADADGPVTAVLVNDDTAAASGALAAARQSTGTYALTLASTDTATPGNYHLDWAYVLDGVPQVYASYLEVGPAQPAYDQLGPGMKAVADAVWGRFADLFDSPYGGPYLQTQFQAHFGRGRIAQLLKIGIGRLNTAAQPYQSFALDGSDFPMQQWQPLLEQAGYIEVLKHLIRSYVEQPEVVANQITRFDRRDYMQRWQSILEQEEADFAAQRDVFKMSFMNLGGGYALVAGGIYGRINLSAPTPAMIARPHYFYGVYH